MGTIGGPLGIVESVAPTLVFMIVYLAVRSVVVPVICSAVLSVGFCVYRLVRHQKTGSAIMGLLLAAVCAVSALFTGEARNYYAPGFVVNAFWLIVLLVSLAARTPGLGLIVQVFNQPLEGGFAAWRRRWTENPALYRAYRDGTWLWVGLFALRLALEIPLWAMRMSTALGVVRLLTGIPLFALVVWLTWVIVSPAVRNSRPQADGPDTKQEQQSAEAQRTPDGKTADGD